MTKLSLRWIPSGWRWRNLRRIQGSLVWPCVSLGGWWGKKVRYTEARNSMWPWVRRVYVSQLLERIQRQKKRKVVGFDALVAGRVDESIDWKVDPERARSVLAYCLSNQHVERWCQITRRFDKFSRNSLDKKKGLRSLVRWSWLYWFWLLYSLGYIGCIGGWLYRLRWLNWLNWFYGLYWLNWLNWLSVIITFLGPPLPLSISHELRR